MGGHARVIRAISPLSHGQVHFISVCKTLQLQMTLMIQTQLASYHPHQRKCCAGVPNSARLDLYLREFRSKSGVDCR